MSLGDLVVNLSADTATFKSDLGKAQQQLQNFAEKAQKIVGVLAGVDAAVSFVELIKGAIESAARLDDLSKKTGVAVATLGGLGFAATQSGGDLESMVAATGKLNKSLVEAAGGNKEFGVAFDLLGIKIKDANGDLKTADQAIFEIADKFASYEDGPEKAALALRLFGKAGADVIPILDEGGAKLRESVEYYQKYAGVTAESAAKSHEFEETLGKVKLITGALGRSIAAELLPTLQALADDYLSIKEQSTAFTTVSQGVGTAFKYIVATGIEVVSVFKGIGQFIGAAAAAFDVFFDKTASIGSRLAKTGTVFKAFFADQDKAAQDTAAAVQKILNPLDQKSSDKNTGIKKGRAPILPGTGTAGGEDSAKKILENQIKFYEQQVAHEKEILDNRNKFFDLFNGENLISIRDYYAAKKVAQDENLADTLKAYDKEIAAIIKYRSTAAKATDREEATGKLNKVIEERAKIQREAGIQGLVDSVNQQKAFHDLEKEIQNVNAQVLEFQGHLKEAATIRFDQQNEDLRKRFASNGNDQALAQLDTLRKYTIAQTELNQISQQASIVQDQLANAETRIDIARNLGATSELGGLRAVSDARKKAVEQLQALYENYARVAQASGNPKLVQDAENLRVQLEKLRSESDLVKQKFDTIFTEGFSSAFGDFISGAKSAKDAFKSFADSVVQQIGRIVAQDLATKIFGGGSAGGGIGSSIGGFFANLFGGGKAIGGPVNPDSIYRVGETGPEMFVPNTAGRIVPISEQTAANDSRPVNVVVNVPQSTSRASADQIAAATGLAVNRAVRRNA